MNIKLIILIFFFSNCKLFSQDSLVVCIDDSIHNFNINSSLGSTYSWEIESDEKIASIISGNGSDEIVIYSSSIGIFKLIVDEIDINGCFGTDSLIVVVKENPTTNIKLESYNICEGDSLKISLDSTFSDVFWNNGSTENTIYVYDEGEYFAELTDKFGCKSTTDTIFINQYEKPIADFSYYGNCINNPIIFQNKSLSEDEIQIKEWTVENNSFYGESFEYLFNRNQQHEVFLFIATEKGCRDSITKLINIEKPPKAEYSFFTTNSVDFDSLVYFTNTSDDVISFNWSFGDSSFSSEENPIHIYRNSGIYNVKLIVSDSNFCIDSVVKQIAIKIKSYLYIPNTFTPDYNSINDSFAPVGNLLKKCKSYKFFIYNRWGERIFYSSSISEKWDGKNAQAGLYIWFLEIEDSVGEIIKRTGEVKLYR